MFRNPSPVVLTSCYAVDSEKFDSCAGSQSARFRTALINPSSTLKLHLSVPHDGFALTLTLENANILNAQKGCLTGFTAMYARNSRM